MATIVPRKTQQGTIFQVKVRLKGFPTRCASFARKTDAARWASATETHLREAKHFPRVATPRRSGKLRSPSTVVRYLAALSHASRISANTTIAQCAKRPRADRRR